jgi:hypothetical protein
MGWLQKALLQYTATYTSSYCRHKCQRHSERYRQNGKVISLLDVPSDNAQVQSCGWVRHCCLKHTHTFPKYRGPSPQANYNDRATLSA